MVCQTVSVNDDTQPIRRSVNGTLCIDLKGLQKDLDIVKDLV